MPIYEFQCKSCGKRFEKLVRMSSDEAERVKCPSCDSNKTARALSVFSVNGGAKQASAPAVGGCACGRGGGCGH